MWRADFIIGDRQYLPAIEFNEESFDDVKKFVMLMVYEGFVKGCRIVDDLGDPYDYYFPENVSVKTVKQIYEKAC